MDSPLLRLPGEIRNQIYKHVFADQHVNVFRHGERLFTGVDNEPDYYQLRHRFSWNWTRLLNLTFACRQLQKETTSLPYNMNVIRFSNSVDFYQWVGITPKKLLASITDIQFDEADHAKYRIGLSRLRALPNLRNVFVPSYYGDRILREGPFVECARKQNGKWRLALAQRTRRLSRILGGGR